MAEHNEILPRLCAYHDGALPEVERNEIEAHVQACSACQSVLADWAALDRALFELDVPQPEPGEIADRVLARLSLQERQPGLVGPRSRRIWTGHRLAIASAAAVILLALGIGFWQRSSVGPVAEPGLAVRTPLGRAADEHKPQSEALAPTAEAKSGEASGGAAAVEAEDRPDRAEAGDAGRAAGMQASEPAAIVAARLENELSNTAAPRPIRPEDTGIPQVTGGPARPVVDFDIHYRLYDELDPSFVELNLVPVFEIEFTPVGYLLANKLEGQWDATNAAPLLLDPEQAYVVSNLRIERATLLALVTNQAPTSDVRFRLAEVTWRLANITADRDDVRSAISAQTEAMRQSPGSSTELRGRLAVLRGLVR